jgi:hypothetical protein
MKYGKVLVSLPKNKKKMQISTFYTSRAAATGVRRNLRHAYSLSLKSYRELKIS